MTPFRSVTGIAAPLIRDSIDTDQIAPAHICMQMGASGYGDGLFFNWRYLAGGGEDPDFVLNREPFRRASFLLAGANFGCGSSREYAVWALRDFGIRAVIAPGFGSIFADNCYMNGVLPISLPAIAIAGLADEIGPGHETMTVDLAEETVTTVRGGRHAFHLPRVARERLLDGLDAIAFTQKREQRIAAFQAEDGRGRPWVYLAGEDIRT